MKKFDVYKHPIHGYEAVKHGFSWPALFFAGIWLFIKRLWRYAVGFLGTILLLSIFEGIFKIEGSDIGVLLIFLLEIGIVIFIASKGNEWRRKCLGKRGYQHINTIKAATPDAAIAFVASPIPVAVSPQAQDFDQQLRRLAGLKEEGII
jgi:hypothetical protein